MQTQSLPMRVYNPDRGGCGQIRDSNIFLYWPHGFGDWVFLSYVLAHFGNGNRFWVSRFGDDNVSVFEGSEAVRPAYSGYNQCSDGDAFGLKHFGLRHEDLDGSVRDVRLPLSLCNEFKAKGVETMLWSGFAETHGRMVPPHHTKARQFLTKLNAAPEGDLTRALKSCIPLAPPAYVSEWGRARIANVTGGPSRKICVIGRTGYTSVGKNWGHKFREDLPEDKRYEASEAVEFIELMQKKNARWVFITLDEGDIPAHCRERGISNVWSYYDVFGKMGELGIPFGLSLKCLFQHTDLFVGVPAGPFHLSMIYPDFPTIGLWIEHLPCWYDEPKANAFHLISRNVRDSGLWDRPGSFAKFGDLHHRCRELDSRIIPGEAVLQAVKEFL